MSENINYITLALELTVTFAGVFLAFMLDRAIDWNKERQTRNELIKNIACELKEMKKILTGDAYKLYPDVWDSAVASGKLELLNSDQLAKLTNVYRKIKGTDYEAVRVRDAKEAYMNGNRHHIPNGAHENWNSLSSTHITRMEETKALIDEVLKEPWLNH
jgi:hypothetical protein